MMAVDAKQPLNLLVLADLCATRRPTSPFRLSGADGFDQLLSELEPTLVLEVPNRLAATPATLEVRLELGSLHDLAPQALLDRLPTLAPLRGFLDGLRPFLEGRRAEPELRAWLAARAADPALAEAVQLCSAALDGADAPGSESEAASNAPASTAQTSLDRLLDAVAVPSQEARAASAIGSLVAAVGRRGRGPIPAPAAQSPLALAADRIAERIDDQLAALLQHPRLRRAEATLRSLRLLCGRTDFRRRIRLDVLHLEADRARTDETLAAVLEASDHHLILVGWELDPGADLELLQWLGEQGDALQAPVLFSVARAFLGLEGETPRLPSGLFEQPRYQGWNALREQECARWLAGSFNRFLLRPPHRRRAGSDLLDDHLFGEPAWLLGALIVQSFARSGWPTEISGTSGGRIDDLPLRDLELRGRGRIQTPLEFPLEQRAVEDLVRAGLCALFAPEDSDRAFVLAAPTLFCLAEQKPAPLRARSIGLPYQLLAARLARAVAELKPELVGLGSVEAVRTRLGRFLEDLLSDTGAGSSVAVEVVPGSQTVRLELRTGKAILGGVRLELGFQLLG